MSMAVGATTLDQWDDVQGKFGGDSWACIDDLVCSNAILHRCCGRRPRMCRLFEHFASMWY